MFPSHRPCDQPSHPECQRGTTQSSRLSYQKIRISPVRFCSLALPCLAFPSHFPDHVMGLPAHSRYATNAAAASAETICSPVGCRRKHRGSRPCHRPRSSCCCSSSLPGPTPSLEASIPRCRTWPSFRHSRDRCTAASRRRDLLKRAKWWWPREEQFGSQDVQAELHTYTYICTRLMSDWKRVFPDSTSSKPCFREAWPANRWPLKGHEVQSPELNLRSMEYFKLPTFRTHKPYVLGCMWGISTLNSYKN